MKRIFCMALAIVMLLLICSPSVLVYAEENDLAASDESTSAEVEDALSFSCSYDTESRRVSISGTMRYETFAKHKKSQILIYAVPPGASEYDVAKKSEPIAVADATIRFNFSFKPDDLLGRYSRYAIFLRAADGTLTLGTEAQYPEVESKVQRDKTGKYFKGLFGCETSYYSDVDAGTVIIPVYLDDLFTKTSGGYVYHTENGNLYFSRSYIDKLDSSIRSVTVSGGRVYLQYLLKSGESFELASVEGASYYLPDIYDEDNLLLVHSLTDFLISRYNDGRGAGISGIVVGKSLDDHFINNNSSQDTLESYAQKCGDYAIAVANSARSIDPSVDIVLPFSAYNFLTDAESEPSEGCYSVTALIESLMKYWENSLEAGLDCSFLIESREVPFGISSESIANGVDLEFSAYSSEIYAGNQKAFSDFLKNACEKYMSGSAEYMFLWNAPADLSGNALACAYAYSYYALRSDSSVSAFVADLSLSENDRMEHIYKIAKYIDTTEGLAATKNLLEFFSKESWDELLEDAQSVVTGSKSVYVAAPMQTLPEGCKGYFDFFDFAQTYSSDGWYRGIGCQSLKTTYAASDRKALCATLALSPNSRSEIVYSYENYERVAYTPYLNFEIQLADDFEGSLYEVSIVFENASSRLESFCVLKGNELSNITLNLAEARFLGSFDSVESLKISVRSIYGDAKECTLRLYGVRGYSSIYSSEELQSLIEKERDKINSAEEQTEELTFVDTVIAIAVMGVTGIIGIAIFLLLKRNNRTEKDE